MATEIKNVNLEEALAELKYACDHAQEYSGKMQGIIDNVLEGIRNFKDWVLIRSSIAPIPYSYESKAFLFTSTEAANAALSRLEVEQGIGVHLLEVYEYPLYEENIFKFLKRHGIEKVCVNNGQNALTISLEKIGATAESNPFTAVVDQLVMTSHDEEQYQKAENSFTQKLSSCQLYYVTPEDGEYPALEPYYVDGLEQNVLLLFTDKTELNQQYPRIAGNIVCERAIQIFKRMKGTLFVINPASSNILVGKDSIDACIDIWDTFTNIFIAVKHHVGDKETAIKYTKEIVKNRNVCNEYLLCITSDDPDYPEENALRTVAGYTAEMISDITDSTSMEMTYAIMAAVFDAPRDSIKASMQQIKEKLQA